MSSEQKNDPAVAEAETLRAELAMLRARLNSCKQAHVGAALVESKPTSFTRGESGANGGENSEGEPVDKDAHLTIVVLGASGDLAVKKTYPALFALYRHNLLPERISVVGYARSEMKKDDFLKKISSKFGKDIPEDVKKSFLNKCWYHQGQYDSKDDFKKLDGEVLKVEEKSGGDAFNRIFYMALPPTAFVPAAKSIKASAMATKGWNRVVVEKPFGRDLESSNELGRELGALFTENEIYRIDHYLGKEMVQNLMVLRFANKVFEPLWNRDHINCVMITFKEDFGTQGRGGYFDNFGIIRDVMQNHLLQMLSIVCMEPPVSMSAEDVRDEKVKLLRSIAPITVQDTVIGQYTADPKGKEPGYLDDPEVPKDSVTPTYAVSVLHVNNSRWMGIPFILKCGKALNEKKADIRIQFKYPVNTLFDDVSPNELVLRVGPDEAVYLKLSTKEPGLDGGNIHTELDLTYKKRFSDVKGTTDKSDSGAYGENASNQWQYDAYERLILDVVRGDHNLFVRADELAVAWKIFTPLLHAIEKDKALKPIKYAFGSRGPPQADALITDYGYIHTDKYQWEPSKSPPPHMGAHGAATSHRSEPNALVEYIKAIEGTADKRTDSVSALLADNATVDSTFSGSKPAKQFFQEYFTSTKNLKFVNKHKLVDPSAPQTFAVYFSASGKTSDGSTDIQFDSMELLELTEDGKKIKKLSVFTDPKKLGSKL